MAIDRKLLRDVHLDLIHYHNVSWRKFPINAKLVFDAEQGEYVYLVTTVNKRRMAWDAYLRMHDRPVREDRLTLYFKETQHGIRPTWEEQSNECFVTGATQCQLEWLYDHAMRFALKHRCPTKQRQFYLRLLRHDFLPTWTGGSGLIFAATPRQVRRRAWRLANPTLVLYRIALKKHRGDKQAASRSVWKQLREIDAIEDRERSERVARFSKPKEERYADYYDENASQGGS